MSFEDRKSTKYYNPNQSEPDPFAHARQKLWLVGMALIIVAVLGAASNIGLTLIIIKIEKSMPPTPPPSHLSQADKLRYEQGREAAPGMMLFSSVISSLFYVPVLIGGLGLKAGHGRGMGFIATVFAMLPCSLLIVIGIPVGFWAVVVLNQSDVVDALSQGKRRPRRENDDDEARPRRRPRDDA